MRLRDLCSSLKADLVANNPTRDISVSSFLKAYLFDIGFSCIAKYRFSCYAKSQWGVAGKLISKLIWLRMVSRHGVHISQSARIGDGLCLPHPVGIVVGGGCLIGSNVTIYQNVTIGRSNKDTESYPSISDFVVLYSGCVVVGNIQVGQGAVVGANAVLSQSVGRNSLTLGAVSSLKMRQDVS